MAAAGSPGLAAAALCALAAWLPSCSACPAAARELAAHPDYGSPEAAAQSFLAALGCDDAAGEYRAFSESLKARHGATLDVWLLARPAVRAELGAALRHAHRLEFARRETREDGVLTWWSALGRERVGLLMRAEHYLEFTEDDGRRVGVSLERPPGTWLRVDGKEAAFELRLADPNFRGLDPARVVKVAAATEWKLEDWVLPVE